MNKKEQTFVAVVWKYYQEKGRHTLPWRKTKQPYHILVSELMLQQTQVDRVIPKYQAFIRQYPTVSKLAAAPLAEVLKSWQGLGYNRRAKFLHQAAQAVVAAGGRFPKTYKALLLLPGVGPYTAAAIMVFAYNEPVPLIETNVRQVYLHHFFKHKTAVTDTEILQRVERTLPLKQPREWFAALMDYGVYLKQTHGNNTSKSKHYTKQSRFLGSDRQVRGAIIRLLSACDAVCTSSTIAKTLSDFASEKVLAQLEALVAEGLVQRVRGGYRL